MSTTLKRREMYIGGKWGPGSGSEYHDIVNPATGKVIAEVPRGTEEDVNVAVTAARNAFDDVWFDTTPRERSERLLKLAEVVTLHAGGVQRRHRPRRSGRRRPGPPPRRGDGFADRGHSDWQSDRAGRGVDAQASAPRAWRQGARDRLRRRGSAGSGRGDQDRRLLQPRAGLHIVGARPRLPSYPRQAGQGPRPPGRVVEGRGPRR